MIITDTLQFEMISLTAQLQSAFQKCSFPALRVDEVDNTEKENKEGK